MNRTPRIGIMGAGAIGCYVGGALAAEGGDVVLVGRASVAAEVATAGLALVDLDPGERRVVPAQRFVFATDASALAACDIVLCCVKSAQTAEAGASLAAVLRPDTVVVSFQNGVRNAAVLRAQLPAQRVLGAVVGFNVVARGDGAFRRATSGPIVIEHDADPRVDALVRALAGAGFEVETARDIAPHQWSKLVMNLNNAVGALSDRPTPDLLFVPGYRRVLRATMREALGVMRRAGVRTARVGPLPVALFPWMLRLPSPVLRLVARAQVQLDPEARSSMWQDLSRGRSTEVDQLNGEIVRLAASCGARAPLNARMCDLVHAAEARAAGSPKLAPDALWRALTA